MTPQDIEAVANGAMAGIAALRVEALRLAASVASRAGSEPVAWQLQFLTDVVTAAGLLEHGKRDKGLAERIGQSAFRWRKELFAAPDRERAASLVASEDMVKDSARWRLLRTWEHQGSVCDNTGITLTFRFDGIDGDGFEDDEPMWLDSVVDATIDRASAGEAQS